WHGSRSGRQAWPDRTQRGRPEPRHGWLRPLRAPCICDARATDARPAVTPRSARTPTLRGMGSPAGSAAPFRSGAEVDPLHPHHLAIHEGYTNLHARMDGTVGDDPFEGLFDFDTRIVSWHRLTVAGQQPTGVAAPSLTSEAWDATLNVRLDGG